MTPPARQPSTSQGAPTVAICIVTYNDADDLSACLEAIVAQPHRPLQLIIVDCDSADESVAIAEAFDCDDLRSGRIVKQVHALGTNRGFAGGMNFAFAQTEAPYVLTLNADVSLGADYIVRLLARAGVSGGSGGEVGAVTGRLVRPSEPGQARRLDACGMYLTRQWRHLDRGSAEIDEGQYAVAEQVFAGTGAATLYLRRALDDVAVDGEIFAEPFHSYREDAELGFRLQGRGWRTLYEPAAGAVHRRSVGSGQRRGVAAAINRSSLKNRYLLRIYHQSVGNFWRTLPWTLSRDLLALGWVLLAERSSLGAYAWLWRHRRDCWRRRRYIQQRRTHPQFIEQWFRRPAMPLE